MGTGSRIGSRILLFPSRLSPPLPHAFQAHNKADQRDREGEHIEGPISGHIGIIFAILHADAQVQEKLFAVFDPLPPEKQIGKGEKDRSRMVRAKPFHGEKRRNDFRQLADVNEIKQKERRTDKQKHQHTKKELTDGKDFPPHQEKDTKKQERGDHDIGGAVAIHVQRSQSRRKHVQSGTFLPGRLH